MSPTVVAHLDGLSPDQLTDPLTHKLLIWFRRWLAQRWAAVPRFGLLRFIRDVLHLNGCVFLITPTGFRCWS